MRTTRFLVSFRRNSPTFSFDQRERPKLWHALISFLCRLCSPVRPDLRNRWHQYITVRRLAAERPAGPPAKPASSPSPRTKVTSTAPSTSLGSRRGGRAILAQGSRCRPLRYKMVRNSRAGGEGEGEIIVPWLNAAANDGRHKRMTAFEEWRKRTPDPK